MSSSAVRRRRGHGWRIGSPMIPLSLVLVFASCYGGAPAADVGSRGVTEAPTTTVATSSESAGDISPAPQPAAAQSSGREQTANAARETPRLPTAPARPSRSSMDPVRVVISAIGVDARVVPVGLNPDQSMVTPEFGLAGWYTEGPRPGEPGPAVIVAHLDSNRGPDVFFRLGELSPGDVIEVHRHDGSVRRFSVEGSEQTPKENLPTGRIWNDTDRPVLRLVTCGGTFDQSARSYRDNVIIYANAA